MKIEYTCKFCRVQRWVELDNDSDIFAIERWKPMLCCDRCADFMQEKRKLTDRINRVADALELIRQGFGKQASESAIRSKFEFYTKKFAALVCDYFRKTTVWDEEFVNMLMEKPEESHKICAHYVRGIRMV